ncbi:hypothetical protein [Actinophytocola sp.]|uniref:hypothetical protein n=1 Tax=Actinophytocola sp. TaxID=1872138 RepID=UPI002D23C413|nr:hypothetical protein [Actinophytocola sp.]HYQ70022.1 hypothetical protein [Actinophytocola sp.]
MLSRILSSLKESWRDGARVERVAFIVGAVLFAGGLAHVVVLLVTGGSWTGPTSLRKAATFGLSFGLTLATVAWTSQLIPLTGRARGVLLGAFTAVSVVETALVSMQAWRGVPSHFNFETGFDTAVSMTLAAGGFVIIVTIIGMTLAAFRAGRRQTPAMRLALRFGFATLLVALAAGAAMIATGSVAARGPHPSIAYQTAGFLKPAHAVTMHAVLVIPALAWLLSFTRWGENQQTKIVRLGIVGYAVLATVIIVESVTHTSPLTAPPLAIAVSGLGLAALVVAAGLGVYGILRRPTPR